MGFGDDLGAVAVLRTTISYWSMSDTGCQRSVGRAD